MQLFELPANNFLHQIISFMHNLTCMNETYSQIKKGAAKK